jgi:nucleotide-binding universal stress UspA family protein
LDDTTQAAGPPATLLLASDFSARCDRALDRAAQLAGAWRAGLVVLNVAGAPAAPDLALAWSSGTEPDAPERYARERLREDVEALGVDARLVVARGEPASVIAEHAQQLPAGLVVAAMARDEPFGRFVVGSTVERLARTLRVPLLVVRARARAPYRHVVVATDFSDASGPALRTAMSWFPQAEFVLFHAHKPALRESLDAAEARRIADDIRRTEAAEFLAAQLPADSDRARIRLVVECAPLETALAAYVRGHGVDLVAMGTHGRTGLAKVLLGSAAARLLDWVPCDTLIVRPLPADPPRVGPAP